MFLREIRELLPWIDGGDYHGWIWVGQGLHDEFRGDEMGLVLWDEWSREFPKYKGYRDLAAKWPGFGSHSGAPITMRSLIKESNAARREAEVMSDFTPALASDWRARQRKYSEFGNADRLLDRYGASLMHVPELGQWFTWSGHHWAPATTGSLEWLAGETVRAIPEEATRDMSDEVRKVLLAHAASSQKAAMVANMIRLAGSDPRVCIPAAELDKDPHLLAVGNGVVDLRTGRLLDADRAQRITVATDVEYDPGAQAPMFEQTVCEVFSGDEIMVRFFCRLLGYALLGQPREDVLVIPYGHGANGKSTLMGAIAAALGPHVRSAAAETFCAPDVATGGGSPREDLLRLRSARMVLIGEPDEGSVLREGLVKGVTGGDPITARAPYARASIEFTPRFVPILATNHRPIIKGDDHGIWRRLLLVPFTRNFDKDVPVTKDPRRAEKLMAELPGILRWLVDGALAYQREGLNPPQVVLAARDEYRSDMDLLEQWLDECCEIGRGKISASDLLWQSWEAWAKERGELRLLPSSRLLGRRLASRFTPIRDTRGIRGRGFAGVEVVKIGEITRVG